MKDRSITIEPIQYEESTRDIILNNTKAGQSYWTESFKKITNVTDGTIFKALISLSEEGYFKNLGLKRIPTRRHDVRVFKRK